MKQERLTRLENQVLREISTILMRQVKDPRIHLCTVSHVKITRDLSKAEIFLSIIGTEEEISSTMDGVQSARGYIRKLLGKNLKVRQIPELHFMHDRYIEDGDRMINLIDQTINDEDKKKTDHDE